MIALEVLGMYLEARLYIAQDQFVNECYITMVYGYDRVALVLN